MKILRSAGLIIILSLLTNMCILFVLNYAISNTIHEDLLPYNLSENYIELVNKEQISAQVQEIIDFHDYDHLIVIAEMRDSRTVGLLDLQMKYYKEASKVTVPNINRYFSEKDYSSGAQVGILVNTGDIFDLEGAKASKTTYELDEVINSLYSDLWDYGSVNLLQNLYSVDFNEVTRVFVDSTDFREINRIKNELLNHGFKIVEKERDIPLLPVLLTSMSRGKNQRFLVVANISVFVMYIYMSFVFFLNYKKYIRVSRIVGGDFIMMIKSVLLTTGVISLIVSGIAYLLTFYFEYLGVNNISLINFLKVQGFMLLCNLMLTQVNFTINYKLTDNLARRS